jgi:hypothetical protein
MAAEPTSAEKSILFILMAEAQEIPNALITKRYQTALKPSNREKLARRGLIRVRNEKNRLYLELTDLGWKECMAEFGAPTPARVGAGAAGGALYAMLGAIKRYLDLANVPYSDFFLPDANPRVELTPAEIEARIRTAYAALAREPGDWVGLADLRDRLDGMNRDQVDRVLMTMNRTKGITVAAESNQKALTKRDRDAAVEIGNQHRHLLAIG